MGPTPALLLQRGYPPATLPRRLVLSAQRLLSRPNLSFLLPSTPRVAAGQPSEQPERHQVQGLDGHFRLGPDFGAQVSALLAEGSRVPARTVLCATGMAGTGSSDARAVSLLEPAAPLGVVCATWAC